MTFVTLEVDDALVDEVISEMHDQMMIVNAMTFDTCERRLNTANLSKLRMNVST